MKPITITRDSFSFTLDPSSGSLRRIMVDGECAIYRIFSAFRDSEWGTPQPALDLLEHCEDRLVLRCDYAPAGHGLLTTTTVTLETSSLRVGYRAEVTQALTRSRLGLCVLLPAALAGSSLAVTDTTGGVTEIGLPVAIVPHQPCSDIAGLEFTIGDRVLRVHFEGDAFEMEDQRNWTDFSYKVYSTPLARPFPVQLPVGTVVEQTVCVEVAPMGGAGTGSEKGTRRTGSMFTLSTGKTTNPLEISVPVLPTLGSRLAADGDDTVDFPIDFVRVDLLPHLAEAEIASILARAGDLPIHLYEWRHAAQSRPTPDSLSQYRIARHTVGDLVSAQLEAPVATDELGPPLVGTDGAFAQLNRTRPAAPAGGTVAFTVSPQVHDFDDEAVVDNLFGLRAVLNSVALLYPGVPVEIGLLELTPHFNPSAGGYAENARTRLVDPRLQTQFALAWAFAAYCEATAAGVESVCLFDASGRHGLLQSSELLPAARLFADVRRLRLRGGPFVVGLPPAVIGGETRYRLEGGGGVMTADPGTSPPTYRTADAGQSESD